MLTRPLTAPPRTTPLAPRSGEVCELGRSQGGDGAGDRDGPGDGPGLGRQDARAAIADVGDGAAGGERSGRGPDQRAFDEDAVGIVALHADRAGVLDQRLERNRTVREVDAVAFGRGGAGERRFVHAIAIGVLSGVALDHGDGAGVLDDDGAGRRGHALDQDAGDAVQVLIAELSAVGHVVLGVDQDRFAARGGRTDRAAGAHGDVAVGGGDRSVGGAVADRRVGHGRGLRRQKPQGSQRHRGEQSLTHEDVIRRTSRTRKEPGTLAQVF